MSIINIRCNLSAQAVPGTDVIIPRVWASLPDQWLDEPFSLDHLTTFLYMVIRNHNVLPYEVIYGTRG